MNDLPAPRLATAGHTPVPTCPCTAAKPAAAGGEPAASGWRLGPTHALILLIVFLGAGCGLFLAGTPLTVVFALLSGLGAIGAATLAAAGGGRRLAAVLIEAAVRSGAGK
jgi:hypothetical protein